MSLPCPIAARACFLLNPLPRSFSRICFIPTPIAPEEHITTRCPSSRSLTTVSTMDDKSWRCSGNGYEGVTIDDVPTEVPRVSTAFMDCYEREDLPSLMTIVNGCVLGLVWVYQRLLSDFSAGYKYGRHTVMLSMHQSQSR